MLIHAAQGRGKKTARSMVLFDVENFLGGSRFAAPNVRVAWARLQAGLDLQAHDSVIVGTSSSCACLEAGLAIPAAARRLRRGRDGAEDAILEAISDYDWIAARFAVVYFVSGDHKFAPAMAQLARRGVMIVCVCGVGGCSKQCRLACHRFIQLDDPDELAA